MSRDDLVTESPLGRVVVSGAALASLVARAAQAVDGVRVLRPRRALEIAVGADAVHVAVRVDVLVGTSLAAAGRAVQEAVSGALGTATGRLVRVDVAIEDVGRR